MSVLLIDNFDSFTYNLYQYLGELTEQVTVVRNDVIPFDLLSEGVFSHIVISPGPGNPTDHSYFGGCKAVIKKFHGTYPLLGICLGHQGIAATLGARVIKAPVIMHGKTSIFTHSGSGLFNGLPKEITAMRYHSLAVEPASMPQDLLVDAAAEDGSIMAYHHSLHPTFGLQFHPESFGTPAGKQLLRNFLASQSAPASHR